VTHPANPSTQLPPNPTGPESIVLIGFMGTGKTTIGRRLARSTDLPFEDTDDLIVERAGLTIPEIFRMHGEAAFRKVESESLAKLDPRCPRILSTGGGIVLAPANRARLRELGFVVWLSATEEEIQQRVSRNRKRPLMQGGNPRETIQRLLGERTPFYRETADWTLDTTGLAISETVRLILGQAEIHARAGRRD